MYACATALSRPWVRRLVEESVTLLEVASEPGDSCELGHDLCAAGVGLLELELLAEAPLRGVEIVEVPERSETVVHVREGYSCQYALPVKLTVVPPIDDSVRRALETALGAAGIRTVRSPRYADSWRNAALREGVERDEPEAGYAPSPRSTRGATRA